jgi:hypothetical protein
VTPEHEAHLQRIISAVTSEIDAKYRKGQEEHGGNLWLKPGMLDNAIEEVLDLCVYLFTLREQLARTTTPPKPALSDANACCVGASGTAPIPR